MGKIEKIYTYITPLEKRQMPKGMQINLSPEIKNTKQIPGTIQRIAVPGPTYHVGMPDNPYHEGWQEYGLIENFLKQKRVITMGMPIDHSIEDHIFVREASFLTPKGFEDKHGQAFRLAVERNILTATDEQNLVDMLEEYYASTTPYKVYKKNIQRGAQRFFVEEVWTTQATPTMYLKFEKFDISKAKKIP
ncbi:hypothetical protein HNV12_00365 [Methanococcoides sp. SA1]|nr:hypothetical protein [Methanococcoides sp. SA1]